MQRRANDSPDASGYGGFCGEMMSASVTWPRYKSSCCVYIPEMLEYPVLTKTNQERKGKFLVEEEERGRSWFTQMGVRVGGPCALFTCPFLPSCSSMLGSKDRDCPPTVVAGRLPNCENAPKVANRVSIFAPIPQNRVVMLLYVNRDHRHCNIAGLQRSCPLTAEGHSAS